MRLIQGERGFTLVELMLSTLLLSILFVAVWGLFGQGVVVWKQGEQRADTYDSLRVSLGRMTRELRYTMGILSSSDVANLYFINAEGKYVRYYCSANEMIRGERGPTGWGYIPVASDIESIRYSFSATTGMVIDDTNMNTIKVSPDWPDKINLVKITIKARKQGSKLGPVTMTQKVSIRTMP